jgi:3-phosphoshikimate 1-carboxyvinyltransferase
VTQGTMLTVRPAAHLRGRVRVPGDKSISHRAVMLAALADGISRIDGFLPAGDCQATVACMRALGVLIERRTGREGDPPAHDLTVHGRGLNGLHPPAGPLHCARSGTTMRLLAGILAGQSFDCCLTGDPQLLKRPMRRITAPLREMGAEVEDSAGCAPLTIRSISARGGRLRGIEHRLAVASAQVKSALLLAGLYAAGPTIVRQCGPARDHTERMLAAMGVEIRVAGLDVTLLPPETLRPLDMCVPGDFSSAAFPLAAAALLPGSELTIEGVGVNPTRTGLLDVLQAMGAPVVLEHRREQGGEPVADLVVHSAGQSRGVERPHGAGRLCAARVGGDQVVRMIDEFPILAVAATQARGQTVVRDAAELRVKETDRIATVVAELNKLGAAIEARPDGFVVSGPAPLRGAVVDSHGDHRLAMALAVAGLLAEGETVVQNADCIADSFPGFARILQELA